MSECLRPHAHQAPLSMEFSKQEYWNGLPFPSPGDLPDPGIEPGSLMSLALGRQVLFFFQAGSLSLEQPRKFNTRLISMI